MGIQEKNLDEEGVYVCGEKIYLFRVLALLQVTKMSANQSRGWNFVIMITTITHTPNPLVAPSEVDLGSVAGRFGGLE